MEVITSETGITIGLAVASIGAVVWLTKMWSATRSSEDRLDEIGTRIENTIGLFSKLERRLDDFIRVETIAMGNKEQIQLVNARINELEKDFGNLTERLARFETKLDIIIENLRK